LSELPDPGTAVNTSSVSPEVVHDACCPFLSIYNTSQWGIEGFYESMSQELAPLGIATTLRSRRSVRVRAGPTPRERQPANSENYRLG
jgi:NAD(P)-dependent dehydrogenase (short-subunit alcohol dehydrogenase family)